MNHEPMKPSTPDRNSAHIDEMFRRHIAENFSGDKLRTLQSSFQREHIVALRGFCPPELFPPLQAEAFGMMDRFGVARNLVLKITDSTPRHMTTVGQPVIKEHGPIIHAIYFSPVVKYLLSQLLDEEVFTCPYAGEHYVISRLQKSGDTHGWHWDDYTYGLVLVLEAPDYRDGGFVQGVQHTAWDKKNPDVHGALLKSQVRSYAFHAGDAYVIKTDTTMHRVYPIRSDSRRTIINMTWVKAADLDRPMTHETNNVLFGGEAPDPATSR